MRKTQNGPGFQVVADLHLKNSPFQEKLFANQNTQFFICFSSLVLICLNWQKKRQMAGAQFCHQSVYARLAALRKDLM